MSERNAKLFMAIKGGRLRDQASTAPLSWPLSCRLFVRVLALLSSFFYGSAVQAQTPLYEPDVERQDIREADIDTELFEVGAFVGLMSLEDFQTRALAGVRFAYHANELLFLETRVARTGAMESAFERLSGSVDLIAPGDRALTYYQLNAGLNLLPGEFFWQNQRAWNMNVYLLGGAGGAQFAGSTHFTLGFGTGINWVITDWMTVDMAMMAHMFDLDVLGEEKNTVNLSWTTGVGFFF